MHLPVSGRGASTITSKSQSLGYVTMLAATTAISGFLFGFDTAVINGVLLLLRRQFALSNFQTEAAASSLLLGCLLGAASASMIGDRYGRNRLALTGPSHPLKEGGGRSAGVERGAGH